MSRIVKMEVYPVAGKDCMELNLSGAHAPYFTRNIVVLYDENGETGVGEVPERRSQKHLRNVSRLLKEQGLLSIRAHCLK